MISLGTLELMVFILVEYQIDTRRSKRRYWPNRLSEDLDREDLGYPLQSPIFSTVRRTYSQKILPISGPKKKTSILITHQEWKNSFFPSFYTTFSVGGTGTY